MEKILSVAGTWSGLLQVFAFLGVNSGLKGQRGLKEVCVFRQAKTRD